MKQTEQFQLSQWDSTDRIKMEDFNTDNAKIEAALNKKLEPVLLLDKTEELTDQLYWNVQLPFAPGELFAFFILLTLPSTGGIYLNETRNSAGSSSSFFGPAPVVACFPLRDPTTNIYFVGFSNMIENSKALNKTYANMNYISIRPRTNSTSSPLSNGTYRIRIYGIR